MQLSPQNRFQVYSTLSPFTLVCSIFYASRCWIASAFPVRSRQTAEFFKRVLLSFKKIKIDIVKEK